MKRYFYDCPIKAAYMAKYFGIAFEDKETNPEQPYRVTLDLMVEGGDFDRPLSRYLIHPDSLHILEPQQFDWVKADELTGGMVSDLSRENRECVVYFDGYCIVPPFDEIEILQRNGNAFIWPEVSDGE